MSRFFRVFDQVILALIALGCWQIGTAVLGSRALPAPIETVRRLAELCFTASFWLHAGETAWAVAISGLIVALAGSVLGLALGLKRFATEVASPILVAAYAVPKVVLYPVILLLFGISLSAKVALGILNGIAPVVIVAMEAARNVSPSVLRSARVFHLSPTDTIVHILLPATLPEVLMGIRIGLALTIVGVLISEIFGSNRGLGFLLTTASQLNDSLTVMALTLFIVIAALAANWLVAGLSVALGYTPLTQKR